MPVCGGLEVDAELLAFFVERAVSAEPGRMQGGTDVFHEDH